MPYEKMKVLLTPEQLAVLREMYSTPYRGIGYRSDKGVIGKTRELDKDGLVKLIEAAEMQREAGAEEIVEIETYSEEIPAQPASTYNVNVGYEHDVPSEVITVPAVDAYSQEKTRKTIDINLSGFQLKKEDIEKYVALNKLLGRLLGPGCIDLSSYTLENNPTRCDWVKEIKLIEGWQEKMYRGETPSGLDLKPVEGRVKKIENEAEKIKHLHDFILKFSKTTIDPIIEKINAWVIRHNFGGPSSKKGDAVCRLEVKMTTWLTTDSIISLCSEYRKERPDLFGALDEGLVERLLNDYVRIGIEGLKSEEKKLLFTNNSGWVRSWEECEIGKILIRNPFREVFRDVAKVQEKSLGMRISSLFGFKPSSVVGVGAQPEPEVEAQPEVGAQPESEVGAQRESDDEGTELSSMGGTYS